MSGNRLLIGLIVSLAFNGVLIGAVGGIWAASTRNAEQPSVNAANDRGLAGDRMLTRNALELLPDDKRRAVERELAQRWSAARLERRAVMRARLELRQALTADPYDPDAVKSAFTKLRAAEDVLKTGVHDTVVAVFGDLSPELRAIAVRPSFREKRGPRGDFGDRRPPRGPGGRPPPPRFGDEPRGPPPERPFPDGGPPDSEPDDPPQ